MGYVFGGCYIPLSCKLVELALTKVDLGNEDLQKHITGEYFCRVKGGSVKQTARKTGPDDRSSSPEQVALVYFIGGRCEKPVELFDLIFVHSILYFRNHLF